MKNIFLKLFAVCFSLLCSVSTIFALQAPAGSETVAKLEVGLGGYLVGEKLQATQIEYAQKNLVEKSYQGTYKFKDQDVFIVADQENNLVLALYQEYEDLNGEQLKKLISTLMLDFGEPTTIAHDTMIYWFYNQAGKISEESYLDAKKAGAVKQVLMVKLRTDQEITAVMAGEGEKVGAYLMISSEMMLKSFLASK